MDPPKKFIPRRREKGSRKQRNQARFKNLGIQRKPIPPKKVNEPQPEPSVPKQKVKVEKSKNGTKNSKNKGTPPGQTSMRRFLAGCSATSWNVTSTSNIPRNKRKCPDFTITEQGELVESRLRSKVHKQQKPKLAPKRNKFVNFV